MTDRDSTDARPPEGAPDEIAELLHRAGRRPPVPADEIARIKVATHDAWEEKVRRRRPRRVARVLAGLAAASLVVGVAAWYWSQVQRGGDAGSSMARVQSVTGAASIRTGSEDAAPRAIVVGQQVTSGSRLTTADGGRIALLMPSGHSVRIDRASRVRMLSVSRLGLEVGAVYVDSGPTALPEPLAILTRAGEVRDVGTQFEARLLEASLRIRVREGSVSVDGGAGVHEVSAGSALELAQDGSVARTDFPTYGPEWDWIADVTPTMDVEGRPLREFLEWVARERGWTLAFADAPTEQRASAITVEGSIEGLTLDQALGAVLETCRLTYEVERGELKIE